MYNLRGSAIHPNSLHYFINIFLNSRPSTLRSRFYIVEAMLIGVSLKEAASRMILKAACPKCKEILGIIVRPPKDIKATKLEIEMLQGPKDRKPRKKLSEDVAALSQIKELWIGGELTQSAIAENIGYPRATVSDKIRQMVKSGDLLERAI
jgi:uncharacterized membrane protein